MSTQHIARTGKTRNDWETPWDFFNALAREFNFGLDACATGGNAKVSHYFASGALERSWVDECDSVWCNPPYSDTAAWLEKAVAEMQAGATVVMLIPARTDTRYWHDWVMPYASEIRLVKGRLKFEGAPSSAPFPSAVIVFRPGWRYPAPILTAMDARPRGLSDAGSPMPSAPTTTEEE